MKKQANQNKCVIVTGATSVIGQPVLTKLRASGACVLEVSRQSYVSDNNVLAWDLQSADTRWQQTLQQLLQESTAGLSNNPAEQTDSSLRNSLSLVHCAPIWLLAQHLDALIELCLLYTSPSPRDRG